VNEVIFMKRGQAALEFLTTYGWAFLVILIMIGALAYFGVLNPPSLLPSRCVFSPELACLEQEIIGDSGGDGILRFRVRNNVGSMASFEFNATEIATDTETTCVVGPNNGVNIRSGRIMNVNCTFTGNVFPIGDKIKFEVETNYTKVGGAYSTPVKGEIYAEAK